MDKIIIINKLNTLVQQNNSLDLSYDYDTWADAGDDICLNELYIHNDTVDVALFTFRSLIILYNELKQDVEPLVKEIIRFLSPYVKYEVMVKEIDEE